MTVAPETIESATRWKSRDPNPTTAAYVQSLLDKATNNDQDDDSSSTACRVLTSLFPPNDRRISFGTAGLRAAMKPGPLCMNDLTVVQAAQGLAKYCLSKEQHNNNGKKPIAVVGYDHRENKELNISSLSFAIHTALVFEQAGMECILLDGFVLTPLVPFVLNSVGAAVGIMITASHNPKQDDGYKVYASDGCQIRSPMDKEISGYILENLEPWVDYRSIIEERRKSHADPCVGLSNPQMTQEMINKYFGALKSSGLRTGQGSTSQNSSSHPPPSFAYSAMHGVGHRFAVQVFEAFGLPPFQSILEQQVPDPTFPTVPFPNPEEKGALNIAKAFSQKNGCNVVLANDPDADRLAVAELDPTSKKWTVFHGDQIGTMIGLWIWEQVGKKCGKVCMDLRIHIDIVVQTTCTC